MLRQLKADKKEASYPSSKNKENGGQAHVMQTRTWEERELPLHNLDSSDRSDGGIVNECRERVRL